MRVYFVSSNIKYIVFVLHGLKSTCKSLHSVFNNVLHHSPIRVVLLHKDIRRYSMSRPTSPQIIHQSTLNKSIFRSGASRGLCYLCVNVPFWAISLND